MRVSPVLLSCALVGQVVAGSGSTETNGPRHNGPRHNVSFVNKHNYYFDVDGNVVNSVNGKVDWIDEQYFWIVNASLSYSSKDLVNWYRNPTELFNISEPVNAKACSGIFGSCDRPKVIFNEKTKKYVLMAFAAPGSKPGIPIFTSDHLTHGYTFQGHLMQKTWWQGQGAEDLSLAVIDGEGYVIYTTWDMISAIVIDGNLGSIWPPFSQTVVIERLTDDFLNSTGESSVVIQQGGDFPVTTNSSNLVDGQVESPDLFKRGDWWYMVGSGTCSFCNGTTTVAYRSKSWKGPWTFQFVDSDLTCGGQGMGVMTVPHANNSEQEFVYQADRPSVAPLGLGYTGGAIGHGFWKLNFNPDGSIGKIDCSPDAQTTIQTAISTKNIPTTGLATNATDGSGNSKDYWAETNYPSTWFYQTWTSSKTGNLSSVGINLGAISPSQPLAVFVFRYPKDADFTAPFFKWETLSWSPVTADNVSVSLDVVQVPVGASVKRGDRLGFSLAVGYPMKKSTSLPRSSQTASTWGYLITDQVEDGHVLYALNKSHVSFQEGYKSPVNVLENRELKWYAQVD